MGDSNKKIRLLVCGGGNGAHVCAGLASLKDDIDVRVLTLYADEAKSWSACIEQHGPMSLELHDKQQPVEVKTSGGLKISKSPEDVVPGCDVIAFIVPAFAHGQYFEAIKPYITKPTILFAAPGSPGFDFQAISILGKQLKLLAIFSFESLPWICRIKEFGRCVEVLGFKDSMGGASVCGEEGVTEGGALIKIQHCIGERPVLSSSGHLMAMTLGALGQIVHPSVSWGQWHDWDGEPVSERPLFYQGVSKAGAEAMYAVSTEVVEIANAIMLKHPDVNLKQVKHVYQWYIDTYGDEIADKSTLYSCLRTNRGYAGLMHPTKEVNGKFVPDFTYRYYTQDIPCGLVVVKGIAEIVGMATPKIDEIIQWAQEKMGKEYIVDGKLRGKDLADTRSPQKYGMTSDADMLGLDN